MSNPQTTEKIVKEFDEQMGDGIFSPSSVSAKAEFRGFLRQALLSAVQGERERARRDHYCCKYLTFNPKDFCDNCVKYYKP